jgi:hypothetical protein
MISTVGTMADRVSAMVDPNQSREVPGALCYARPSGGGPRGRHLEITVGATGEATKGVMPCGEPG